MSKTIVFIHGAWVTPSCWDGFKTRYEKRGYNCLAPAWPFDDRPVPELRRNPASELGKIGITEIVDHYAEIIKKLPERPILVGHSFGGLFVQLLLDRGLGAAGIAIDSAPPKGVLPGINATRAGLPVLLNWGGWRKVANMSFKNFQWGFVHTLSEPEQRTAYDKHVVPTPGRIYFQATLGIGAAVNFRNHDRSPLLLIAGELDRTVEARMNRSNFKKYRNSKAVTAFKEFPGRTHWLIGAPGWEEIADYAIDWAEKR